MKKSNNTPANMELQNPLLKLKLQGYKQKSISPCSYIRHFDLKWIKVDGYQKSGKGNSAIQEAQSGISTPINLTVYQQMEILQAKSQFFFGTMTLMLLLNLVFLFARFIR